MIKAFYGSSNVGLIKEKSNLMFEEVSDGIYLVVKDRVDRYKDYATSQTVAEALNFIEGVSVVHKSGTSGYTNFNYDK